MLDLRESGPSVLPERRFNREHMPFAQSNLRVLAYGIMLLCSPLPATAQSPENAPNTWWNDYYSKARLIALPDGRKLNLLCEGSGSPTIILESGSSNGAWTWRRVQLPLAASNRTCAYDRAGYGGSDAGPFPRDTNAMVADLEALLTTTKIEGPYVLVGHSLGGPIVRMFTDRHRGEVVGMVLIDAGHQRQHERFRAVAQEYQAHSGDEGVRACVQFLSRAPLDPASPQYGRCVRPAPHDLPASLVSRWQQDATASRHWRTTAEEYEAYHSIDSAQIEASQRPFGDLPLVSLTADVDNMPFLPEDQRKRMRMIWMQMHDEAAALSTRGVNRLVPGSAHAIQESNPEVVIATVREVLDAAKAAHR